MTRKCLFEMASKPAAQARPAVSGVTPLPSGTAGLAGHPAGSRHSQHGTLWNIGATRMALFGLDVGRTDHLAPLLGFCRDELAEVSGRACKCGEAEVGKTRLDAGARQARIDLFVELLDDLGGCILGRADTVPPTGLIPW